VASWYAGGGGLTALAWAVDVLGPTGTLCAPTFCFYNEAVDERGDTPVIDPATEPTEMGAIAEATRLWPGACRSTAFRHSVAAVGPSVALWGRTQTPRTTPLHRTSQLHACACRSWHLREGGRCAGRRAEQICNVDPTLSCFDMRSVFGQMLAFNAKILLLGLNYTNCTACHFGEFTIEVPYRGTVPKSVSVRLPNGSVKTDVAMTDYQPMPSADGSYYGAQGPDFNRMGQCLEAQGKVRRPARTSASGLSIHTPRCSRIRVEAAGPR
jgi:aminoglycoside N3'-acetyltransferase